ncbi:hypothetical protein SH449x_005244 [Pirellulaceae bacterium SH449]
MLRFERQTNDIAEVTGAIALAGFAVVVIAFYFLMKMDGIISLLMCGFMASLACLAFLNSLRKILWPTTRFVELSESSLSFGSVERASDTCCLLFDDASRVFVDFDERHILWTDSQGKQRIIGDDLVFTGKQLQQIADILCRELPPDRIYMNENFTHDLTESAREVDRTITCTKVAGRVP